MPLGWTKKIRETKIQWDQISVYVGDYDLLDENVSNLEKTKRYVEL
jgi:hypothetical protein